MQIHNLLSNEIASTIEILGIKWSEVLKKYENRYESADSIHWYLERTNVGALATAAWLCDGVALEEYTTAKENSKEYNGRCDLYFHIKSLKAICEAKIKWIEIRPENTHSKSETMLKDVVADINDVMKLAESDSKAHKTSHRKMHASFICIFWKEKYDKMVVQNDIEDIIERILKNQENSASFKFKTDKALISSAGNVCNLAYLALGDTQ